MNGYACSARADVRKCVGALVACIAVVSFDPSPVDPMTSSGVLEGASHCATSRKRPRMPTRAPPFALTGHGSHSTGMPPISSPPTLLEPPGKQPSDHKQNDSAWPDPQRPGGAQAAGTPGG